MGRFARQLIGLCLSLLLWQGLCHGHSAEPGSIPPPSLVLGACAQLLLDPRFLADALSTALCWSVALALASLTALPLGLLLGSVRVLRQGVLPLLEWLRPLPSVALIPLVISLLGSGVETKITLAAFAATWPILFNTIYALREVDPERRDTARAFGAPAWRVLAGVTLPSVLPFAWTGLRLASSVALIVVISTEFLTGGTRGLGQFIYVWGSNAGRLDLVLGGTLFAGVFGLLIDNGLVALETHWFGWAGEREAR